MNVPVRRALVLSTLTLLVASAACTGRAGDEHEGSLASPLKKIDPGGDPGPTDPPDPPDHGGGGGHHVRDAGVADSMSGPQPDAAPDVAAQSPNNCATRSYFVWRSGTECTNVTLAEGTWVGEPVFPGHASGHCAYRWTGPSLPDPNARRALDDIAVTSYRLPPVVEDCTALPSSCDANDATCAATAAAVGGGKCPPSDPGCGPGIIISCDSCAVAEEDMLYAVIDPSLVSSPTLVGENESETLSFTFTPPAGAQRFAIPIPPGTVANGTVVRLGSR